VNPAAGRERAYELQPTNNPKKIGVVGGGPAGLEFARVAVQRGHTVILWEKADSLGGHLLEGGVPGFKREISALLDWFKNELDILRLDIRIGTEANLAILQQENLEEIVIAAGSQPIVPEIPGVGKERIVTAPGVLRGRSGVGKKVIVLGGGLIGCETALWLAMGGKKVWIAEITKELMSTGIPVQHMNRLMLGDLLKFHQVEILTETSIRELTREGAVLTGKDQRTKLLPADTIVLAVGLKPERALYEVVRPEVANLHLIGDAMNPQNIMGAVWGAYEIARVI
jgi:2-enoate reductase